MDRKVKKEQFLEVKKAGPPKALFMAILLIIVVGVGLWLTFGRSDATGDYFAQPVAAERSYVGRVVEMTEVVPVIEDGEIRLPLAVVDENNIVTFNVDNDEGFPVPLMLYITPSGRLFAGSSMCEPCQGRRFALAGETLVCENCRTTYDIEDHEFISGSPVCGSYPPVYLNPEVRGDEVIIDLQDVLSWRIRTL